MLAATIRVILWQTPNSLSLTPERVSHMSDPDLERSPNTHENNWSLSLHSKVKVVCFLEKGCPLPVFTREFISFKQIHYIRSYWTVLEIICVIITSWNIAEGSKTCLSEVNEVSARWMLYGHLDTRHPDGQGTPSPPPSIAPYGEGRPPPPPLLPPLRCILMSWASEAIGSVSANVRTYVSAIHSLVKLSVCLSLSHQLHTSAFHLSCTGKAELVGGHGHRGGGWVQTWYFQPCGNLSSWLKVQTHAVAIGCGCLEPSVLLSLNFVS